MSRRDDGTTLPEVRRRLGLCDSQNSDLKDETLGKKRTVFATVVSCARGFWIELVTHIHWSTDTSEHVCEPRRPDPPPVSSFNDSSDLAISDTDSFY